MAMHVVDSNTEWDDFRMPHTRGVWIRRNHSDNTIELWVDGMFQCSYNGHELPEARMLDMMKQCVEAGERKKAAAIRKALWC